MATSDARFDSNRIELVRVCVCVSVLFAGSHIRCARVFVFVCGCQFVHIYAHSGYIGAVFIVTSAEATATPPTTFSICSYSFLFHSFCVFVHYFDFYCWWTVIYIYAYIGRLISVRMAHKLYTYSAHYDN